MSGHVYLMGTEDVRSAGNAMRTAATDIMTAASSINFSCDQLVRTLQETNEIMRALVEALRAEEQP